ncbi:hypothetical protein [Flavobacterium sp. H122]|uniref:hypothetical protein n=1 Tax=Flavobacterium sp. H122 TaxID=2529860 RepID=UPI0010A9E117|nr:hypothetical protein [Flavobacterium sp. H122]
MKKTILKLKNVEILGTNELKQVCGSGYNGNMVDYCCEYNYEDGTCIYMIQVPRFSEVHPQQYCYN